MGVCKAGSILNGTYDYGNGIIFKNTSATEAISATLSVVEGTTVSNLRYVPQIFDLTQMFGSTIADYIYSLEQTTAGAGVAWFKKLFPKPYYAYNAGETTCVSAVNGDPYNHYTTTLGRTVYGGTLDVVSGELVVTHGMYVMNGTESYTLTSTGLFRFAPTPTMASGRWYTDDGAISDTYRKVELTSNVADGEIVFGSGNNFIYVRDSRATTVAEFQALLANNNATITYPLATPQTYQLDPQTISLLHGNNNVWSDGSVVMVYNADVGLYIDKKLGTSGTRTLSMTRTLAKSETDDTKSDNIQLAED